MYSALKVFSLQPYAIYTRIITHCYSPLKSSFVFCPPFALVRKTTNISDMVIIYLTIALNVCNFAFSDIVSAITTDFSVFVAHTDVDVEVERTSMDVEFLLLTKPDAENEYLTV